MNTPIKLAANIVLNTLRVAATFITVYILSAISASIYYSVNVMDLLFPFKSSVGKGVAHIIFAILPVGRAMSQQGFEGFWYPSYIGMTETPYCILSDRPNLSFFGRVISDFPCQARGYQINFFILHIIATCLVILIYGRLYYRKVRSAVPALDNRVRVNTGGRVFLRILLLGGILSILWPGILQIVWGVWREYAKLVDTKYTTIMFVDDAGNKDVENPYFEGVALGWFGYYGVFAGVFLSYLLTVLWTTKFVIGRAVKREAMAAGVLGASDGGDLTNNAGVGSGSGHGSDDMVLSGNGVRGRRWWMWRIGIGLLILMLYGWPLVVGLVGRILPDDIWMKWVPY